MSCDSAHDSCPVFLDWTLWLATQNKLGFTGCWVVPLTGHFTCIKQLHMYGLRKCDSRCRQSLNHGKSGTVDQWRKWILGLTEHPIGASLTDEKCSAGFSQC